MIELWHMVVSAVKQNVSQNSHGWVKGSLFLWQRDTFVFQCSNAVKTYLELQYLFNHHPTPFFPQLIQQSRVIPIVLCAVSITLSGTNPLNSIENHLILQVFAKLNI